MATEFDDALKRLEDMLARATASGDTDQIKALTKAMDVMKASLLSASERTKKYVKEIESATATTKSESQARKALDGDIKNQTKNIRDQAKTSKEAKEELQKYIEGLKSAAGTDALKSSIEAQVKGHYRATNVQEGLVKAQESMSKAAAIAAKPMAAVGSVFSAYQSGGSQIGTASAVLQGGMELAGSATEGLGKIAITAGSALMPLGPVGLAVGAGLAVVGIAAQILGKGLSETASKVLPKFSAEVEKNIGAFQSLSSTGAVFAGGLGEMIKTSGTAGYTLDSFSKILNSNRESFANSGLGMTEASKKFSKVSNDMIEKGFRKDLLNLGYTLEEQGGLVSDVFSNLQRTGRMASTSDEQVSKMTREYGENLRTISALTGQDAKAKMAQAKKDMDNLGVQAKMLKLQKDQPEVYEKVQGMLAAMPDEMKTSFLQSFTGDAITDPAMNVLMENVPELRDVFSNLVKVANDPATSPAQALEAQSKALNLAREGFIKNADRLGEIGTAANLGAKGVVESSAKLGGALLGGLAKSGPAAEKQGKAVADAAKTTDKQTEAMSKLIESNNALNVKIQGTVLATDALTSYMNYAAEAADMFTDALEEIVKRFGKPPTEEVKARKDAQAAAKAQTAIVPGLTSEEDIKNLDIGKEIALRQAELEARKKQAELSPNSSRGTLRMNDSASRVKKLEEQIEILKKTKKEAEDKAAAVEAAPTAPAEPVNPAAPAAPSTPVAPVAPISLTKPKTDPKNFTGPGTIDPVTNQWVPKAQPAYNPATISQPAFPQQSKISEMPSRVEDYIKQNQKDLEAKGVDLSPSGEFQKAVQDIKSNPGDGDLVKTMNLVLEALNEGNRFHRETSANTKKTVEVMQ